MIKIFPLWFRLTRFYVKARKINSNNQLSRADKIAEMHKLEKRYIGDKTQAEALQLGKESSGSTAAAIGMKDIAGIYCDLKCAYDCRQYTSRAAVYFIDCKKKNSHIIEAKYFCFLYTGLAYLMDYDMENAFKFIDWMNELVNFEIERQPDNARLQQMRCYGYSKVYDGFVDFYNFLETQETRKLVHVFFFDKLLTWEKNDPGNEKLLSLIDHWKQQQ